MSLRPVGTHSRRAALKRSALESSRETREEYLEEVESLAAQSASLAAAIRDAQEGADPREPARRPLQGSSGR